VQGDIVLESRGSITLKAGASFVVIHPGGVDISGPVVNLNGGGRPGTPVGTLEPGVLKALGSNTTPYQDSNKNDDSPTSGEGKTAAPANSEPEIYSLRFALSEDAVNKPYTLCNHAGEVISEGITGEDGRTPRIKSETPDTFRLTVGEGKWNAVKITVKSAAGAQEDLAHDELQMNIFTDKLELDSNQYLPSELVMKIVGATESEE